MPRPRGVMQAAERHAGVERELQVQDVVDDMLQDLHLADALVLRDAGHELLQLGVAVVHVVQQAEGVVHGGLAPGDPQGGGGVLREIGVAFPEGPHGAYCLHCVGSVRFGSDLPFCRKVLDLSDDERSDWIIELSVRFI